MQSSTRTRAAIVAGAAGLALVGAVGVGAAAFADGGPAAGATSPATASPGAPGSDTGTGTEGPTGGAPAPDGRGPGAAAPEGAGRQAPAHRPHIGGEVTAVSDTTVTVEDRDGFTRTIRLVDGATVTKDGAAATAAAVVVGAHIEATGAVASDGTTLDASSVEVGRPAAGPGGHGHGAPRGERPAPPAGSAGRGDASAQPGAPARPGADAPSPSTAS